MNIPSLPLAELADAAIDFLVETCAPFTRAGAEVVSALLDIFEHGLLACPPWLFIPLLCGITWLLTRRLLFPLGVGLGFALLWNIGLWTPTIVTLALVLASTVLSSLIGVGLGILAGVCKPVRICIMPLLDIMQTMPAFVYLIPAIPFFGIGKVSAMVATVIFSVPPAIRLTCLGIRQTPVSLVECSEAFGATRWQRLCKVELPLAIKTIIAGINQTIMLSLSMAVIAAMIGAGGMGSEVWKAIQRMQIGNGFAAGLGIVIVAVTLDRLFQALARRVGHGGWDN